MRAIWVVAAVCGVLALALGIPLAGRDTPTGLDIVVADAVGRLDPSLIHAFVILTEPYVVIPVLALAMGYCLYRRRFAEAGTAVLGPVIAASANTWLLKPLFGRWKDDTLTLAYPSGHTVSLAATVTVLVLITRRVLVAVVGVLALAIGATGLIGMDFHYFTDIVGGTLFAISVVLLTWCVLRLVPARSAAKQPAGTSSGSPR